MFLLNSRAIAKHASAGIIEKRKTCLMPHTKLTKELINSQSSSMLEFSSISKIFVIVLD